MGQQATGAPVSFHPGRDPQSPFEIMRIFTEAGGNAKKAIMGHLESIFIFKRNLHSVSYETFFFVLQELSRMMGF